MKRFREGLVCKAHRLVYHSTAGLRVIKKIQGERGGTELGERGEGRVPVELLRHVDRLPEPFGGGPRLWCRVYESGLVFSPATQV